MTAKNKSTGVARAPAVDRLLDAALRLFYRDGYHAVGIDAILAEAQVAKMTLYNHFPSKTDLIVAVLERQGARLRQRRQEFIDAAGRDPRARFAAVFLYLEEWFRSPDFNGCAFIRAVGEFPASASPVNRTVVVWRMRYLALLEELLTAISPVGARELAEHTLLLTEGAIVVAHTFRDPLAARRAKVAAEILVAASV